MSDADALCINNKVYIGGGLTRSSRAASTILCYDCERNSWKIIVSPTCRSALTTYQSKLVLVGGKEDDTQHVNNKLWSLQEDGKWINQLPSMPTPRWGTSAVNTGSHLLIAGGVEQQGSSSNVVEVFDGEQWTKTESLPKACYFMKSTLHNGEWYLIGGVKQGKSVFCTTVDSLIATARFSKGEGGSVWKTLPKVPLMYSSIVMCGNLPLAIGGKDPILFGPRSAVYGYIADTKTWIDVGGIHQLHLLNCPPFQRASGNGR